MNMQPSGRFVYFNTDVTFFDNVFLIMELVTGLQIIAEPGIQVCVSLLIIMIQITTHLSWQTSRYLEPAGEPAG